MHENLRATSRMRLMSDHLVAELQVYVASRRNLKGRAAKLQAGQDVSSLGPLVGRWSRCRPGE